ncbi:MAG: DUF4118 domain-containing protein [Caulobacter sp.]|nr:DUF4118 domain-containing protein [Caulobacter sp.]
MVLPLAISTLAAVMLIHMGIFRISMIFLAGVLFSALLGGAIPAVLSAILAFFLYDYFFLYPSLTFAVSSPEEAITLVVFMMVALGTGLSAGAARDQRLRTERRATTLLALVQSSDFLSLSQTSAAIRAQLVKAAADVVQTGALIVDPDGGIVDRAGSATAWRADLEDRIRTLTDEALRSHRNRTTSQGSFRARTIQAGTQAYGVVVWLQDQRGGGAREIDDYIGMLTELSAAALARVAAPSKDSPVTTEKPG